MHQNEAERPGGEVRTFVALIREWNQGADSGQNFRNRPAGGGWVEPNRLTASFGRGSLRGCGTRLRSSKLTAGG
jgi:hypothetical protein